MNPRSLLIALGFLLVLPSFSARAEDRVSIASLKLPPEVQVADPSGSGRVTQAQAVRIQAQVAEWNEAVQDKNFIQAVEHLGLVKQARFVMLSVEPEPGDTSSLTADSAQLSLHLDHASGLVSARSNLHSFDFRAYSTFIRLGAKPLLANDLKKLKEIDPVKPESTVSAAGRAIQNFVKSVVEGPQEAQVHLLPANPPPASNRAQVIPPDPTGD
jgi:hypothetical protein